MQSKGSALRLEELKKRMDKAQPLQIDSSGRLIMPEEAAPTGNLPSNNPSADSPTPVPSTGLRLKPSRWFANWYHAMPERLLVEQKSMSQYFPQFKLVQDEGQLGWLGEIETNRNNKYQIALMYPYDFPSSPPRVYPIDPVVEVFDDKTLRNRHQYPDGHLCLYYPQDRTFKTNSTAATVVGVAAAWFFAYETWLESGKQEWPGDEID
jgi:hypothetical protein